MRGAKVCVLLAMSPGRSPGLPCCQRMWCVSGFCGFLPRVTKTSLLLAWERVQHAAVAGRGEGIG